MTKQILRAVSALALLAFAAPALPCGEKQTTASNAPSASAEKKPAVAKSDSAKKAAPKDKEKAAQSKASTN
jgi:hypothetical protein